MIKYVEKYHLQVKSDIKITKNATNKTEENIIKQEKKKKEQDFFIDVLEMRLKNLTEKKLIYNAQIKSQENETKEAKLNFDYSSLLNNSELSLKNSLSNLDINVLILVFSACKSLMIWSKLDFVTSIFAMPIILF